MEFTFTPIRVGILAALLAGFWLLGGFEFPGAGFFHLRRAWMYSLLLYILGGVSATVVDHWVGNLDRSNLRWLYVTLGVICMGGGLGYQHVLKSRMKIEAAALASPAPAGSFDRNRDGILYGGPQRPHDPAHARNGAARVFRERC